jgi:hypothetical protein
VLDAMTIGHQNEVQLNDTIANLDHILSEG